ncbi:MAG: hypothetical protein WCR42_01175 [bacterium]
MKYFAIIFTLILSLSISINAKDNYKPIKWVVRPSIGITFPLTKVQGGYITDGLIDVTKKSMYLQYISSTLFIGNFGIEFTYYENKNVSNTDRFNKFVNTVNNKYGDKYFAETSSSSYFQDSEYDNINFGKGGLGPVYKFEKDRWLVIARTLFGVTSITTDWGSTTLKGKGTNEIINIDWNSGKNFKDNVTFNPSLTIGYRIAKRIVLDFDLNYCMYNINYKYIETIKNVNLDETTTNNYYYSNQFKEFSVGFGFMFVLK